MPVAIADSTATGAEVSAEATELPEGTDLNTQDYHTVGSIVTFGKYEQDDDLTNGPEDIEWVVLDVQNGKSLLISKYGLDWMPYNSKNQKTSWEKCTLREWLNHDFLSSAFSEAEQSEILMTSVDNSLDQGWSGWMINGGENTEDRIFLLSYAEAKKYFNVTYNNEKNVKARVAWTGLHYAEASPTNGYKTSEGYASEMWWLRSPGSDRNAAAYVRRAGSLESAGVDDGALVRPALWIRTTSENTVTSSGEQIGAGIETAETVRNLPAVGDIFTFGKYEQDNNLKNGPEEIQWMILDVEDGKALLLSKYGLDSMLFHDTREDVTWETCDLRKWLNKTFFQKAFSEEEQKVILTTTVENSTTKGDFSGIYDQEDRPDTEDKIFLLSYTEVNYYFGVTKSNGRTQARMSPTAYAAAQGAEKTNWFKTSEKEAVGWWWLRSSGSRKIYAEYVEIGGGLYYHYVNYPHGCVRPAFWIDLNAYFHPEEQSSGPEEEAVYLQEPAAADPAETVDISSVSTSPINDFRTVGSIVTLGSYEQDNDLTNGKEPIEWRVLAAEDNRSLLISQYALDILPFHEGNTGTTWEESSLRSWLNSTFLAEAFRMEEQSFILLTDVGNGSTEQPSAKDKSLGGNDTKDYIFILSYKEAAKKYFRKDADRQASPTAYARSKFTSKEYDYRVIDGVTYTRWWLRSRSDRNSSNLVTYKGAIGGSAWAKQNTTHVCVRPALWVYTGGRAK